MLPAVSSPALFELLREEAESADGDPFAADALAALRAWSQERRASPNPEAPATDGALVPVPSRWAQDGSRGPVVSLSAGPSRPCLP